MARMRSDVGHAGTLQPAHARTLRRSAWWWHRYTICEAGMLARSGVLMCRDSALTASRPVGYSRAVKGPKAASLYSPDASLHRRARRSARLAFERFAGGAIPTRSISMSPRFAASKHA